MDIITLNVIFNKLEFNFKYIRKEFKLLKFKEDLKYKLNQKFKKKSRYNFLLISNNKIFTEKTVYESETQIISINAVNKNLGGVGVVMFGILVFPLIFIGRGFFRIGEIIIKMFKMFWQVMKIIGLIFDPPALIDDILFAVTFGINEVMNKMSSAISNGMSEPEDDTSEKGIFATRQEEGNATCMSPTYSTLFLLIICPPLAIMYKLGFWKGFVSSIICGVLCVKLFYFPGLLFAVLHVLC
jgi:hypothetical protein